MHIDLITIGTLVQCVCVAICRIQGLSYPRDNFLVDLNTNGTFGDIPNATIMLWLKLYCSIGNALVAISHDFDVNEEGCVFSC